MVDLVDSATTALDSDTAGVETVAATVDSDTAGVETVDSDTAGVATTGDSTTEVSDSTGDSKVATAEATAIGATTDSVASVSEEAIRACFLQMVPSAQDIPQVCPSRSPDRMTNAHGFFVTRVL
jgi:hypothetical protein